METTIEVTPRDAGKKGISRKLRAKGVVPAVVYGPNHPPRPVALDPAVLIEIFKQTQNANTLLQVKISGAAAIPCIVREVQRHPLTREIKHVDLYAPPETPIEVLVPISTVGKPKGALLGGRVRLIRREVRVACRYDAIPATLEVDVSALEVDDFITASQVKLPAGVKLVSDDFHLITLEGKRAEIEEKPAEVKPAEGEAAAPAAPEGKKA